MSESVSEELEAKRRSCEVEAAAAASFLSVLSAVCLVLRSLRCCCISAARRSISGVKSGSPRGRFSLVVTVVVVVVVVFLWPASSSFRLVEEMEGA